MIMSGTTDLNALPAMVTMSIGRWNQVLEILGTRQWTEVNPLIVDLHRQLQEAADAAGPPRPAAGGRMHLASTDG
jgi:hypothetical protein